jgi:tetratricopeptide (TPR) repeat protein
VPGTDLLFALAAERQRLGQHDGALAAISTGIALDPTIAGFHLLRGVILKSLHRPDADSGPLRAAALASNDSRPHVQLGFSHEAAGRPRRAARSFRRASAVSPADPETWLCLARLAYDDARPAATIVYRQRAVASDAKSETSALLGIALVASGRWREALPLLDIATYRRHGPDADIEPLTSFAKLNHDAEQIDHLVRAGRLPAFMAETAAVYRQVQGLLPRDGNPTMVLDGEARRQLAPTYNRLLYRDRGAALDGPAVDPKLDAAEIARAYFASRPQMVVIDNLLTPDALSAVLRFCQDSTIWFTGTYSGGYVGAQMADGFAAPILFQIAEELKARLPGIIGDAGLQHLWAFKYDSRFSGIALHADAARINVNFWITPDEANLDPTSGGLEVFDVAAPPDWNFAAYNSDLAAIREHLRRTGSRSVVVPHRQNRAVLFHSDLFHRTGDIRFREGYLNRRINVTMLYGVRQGATQ